MTACFNSYISKPMRPEIYGMSLVDEEDGDDDFDDDDFDGFDGLTDFEDDDISETRTPSRHGACGSSDSRIGSNGNVFRRQRSASECSFTQLETGDDNRRDHHNQLERKRRASIKTSYNDLREVIPGLRGSKASRAVILQRAVEYIEELVKLNRDHAHCVDTLKRKNEYLDLGNQELQRHVQRFGDDESSLMSCGSVTVAGSGNATLRLCPGTITSSTATDCGPSGLPVYRLVPQDSVDRPGTCHGSQPGNAGFVSSTRSSSQHTSGTPAIPSTLSLRGNRTHPATIPTASTSALPDYNGMNALSAAVSLLASKHSGFSSSSSSSGSNCEPVQSSSQRSSPGCLSSSSLSNASSSNQSNTQAGDERSLQIDVPCEADDESYAAVSENISAHPAVRTSPTIRASSPPSILLTVPIRPSTVASNTSSSKTKQSRQLISVLTTSTDSAFRPNDFSKRRRMT